MAENGNGDTTKGVNIKRSPEKYTKKFDLNEIKPLDSEQQVNVIIGNDTTDDASNPKKTNKLKGTCEELLTQLEISKKARIPFLILIGIIAGLLVILILMTVFWPTIPYFMKADICVEKECLDSSAQVLLWANTSAEICYEPYEWACGKFKEEYLAHEFYGMNGGEWNQDTYADYNDIAKIQAFVGRLKSTRQSSKVHLLLTGLYSSCMNLESLDKLQSDAELRKAIIYLSGWYFGEKETSIPGVWQFKDVLTVLHSKFGIFPFFKVSVENKNSASSGSIITISEGELGLPHKRFYATDQRDKTVQAYKMLLRDFAINFGVVSDKARKFSEEIFFYEQRIVSVIPDQKEPAIMPLSEVQKLAQNLPITESIKAIFSEIEINDRTEILVRDTQLLREMANVVSSSTEQTLNNFIIWSLTRHFLPFMSREYRSALEEFESVLYGLKLAQPKWYFCTKLLKNWVPFALATLQRNPELLQNIAEINTRKYETNCKCTLLIIDESFVSNITFDQNYPTPSEPKSDKHHIYDLQQPNERLISDRLSTQPTNYDHNLLKLIFYHLRDELRTTINSNTQLDKESSDFVIARLAETRLQIGLPTEVLHTDVALNNYYRDYLIQNLHFSDNIEWNWNFKKKKIQQQLRFNNETDRIIAQLFPISDDRQQKVHFALDLNMIIISEDALNKPYYNHKYPVVINFARTGFDISHALLNAIFLFGEQYKEQQYTKRFAADTWRGKKFTTESTDCIERYIDEENSDIPYDAKISLITQILSGRFTLNALDKFLRNIKTNTPIPEALLHDGLSYSLLGLPDNKRQPGLRQYDNAQLFSLALLQRSCGYSHGDYHQNKPYIEGEVDEQFRFRKLWDLIPAIPDALDCSKSTKC